MINVSGSGRRGRDASTPRARLPRWAGVVVVLAMGCSSASGSADSSRPAESDPAEPSATVEEPTPTTEAVDRDFYVATWGEDRGPGTADEPMATIEAAMKRLRPGDTLTVHGGRYEEDIVLDDELVPATAEAPIVIRAADGERPIIAGRLALYDADHWMVSGINVTWSDRNDSEQHMVVFNGGVGFRFSDAELWGARSYSAIVVGEGSRDFRLDHLYIHDTQPSNDLNQDHLVYLASDAVGGVVEHNVLVRSPNGRGIKVGPGDLDDTGAHANVLRFNTFFANEGPSNIQLSGDSSFNEIYGNLFVRPGRGSPAVTAWKMTGSGNIVRDNAAWETDRVMEDDEGLVDGGGNLLVDPRFTAPERDDYRPANPEARAFGAEAQG